MRQNSYDLDIMIFVALGLIIIWSIDGEKRRWYNVPIRGYFHENQPIAC